ncbi:MAG: amidohydrolase family protein [Planctomycetaceae bacterium]
MSSDLRRSVTARFLFPGIGAPLERGTVEIVDGVIAAVHDRQDAAAVDLGNVAIVPGLINVHTHLEFSDLSEPIPRGDSFAAWIRGVVAHRRDRAGAVVDVVRRGLEECVQHGTTIVGEVATDDDAAARCVTGGPGVVVFREVLGFGPGAVAGQLETARAFVSRSPAFSKSRASVKSRVSRTGLSPHAPYSVHPDVWPELVRIANENGAPVAAHVAETREELEFLNRGTGPLAEMLQEFGVWRAGVIVPGTRPMDSLRILAEANRGLVVHGNYLADDEQRFLAGCDRLSLVYCPRTHAYFGHERHPWREVMRRGGNVALGTDGRASNSDLSLWRELQFLRRRSAELSDIELLQLATLNGARALGFAETTGSLAPGNRADLAVVELREVGNLFHAGNRVVGTMIGGEWVSRPPMSGH